MIMSMTGFGRAAVSDESGREVCVELKSVNHKYLDLGIRIPRQIAFAEEAVRVAVSSRLSRGHVDVAVTYKNHSRSARHIEVDTVLFDEYVSAARAAAERSGLEFDLAVTKAMSLSGVMEIIEEPENAQEVSELITKAVNSALDELIAMRNREGERLSLDICSKLECISNLHKKACSIADNTVLQYKAKLEERIASLMPSGVSVDESRLATEIAIFADKTAIDEELVRIGTHIDNMYAMLKEGSPVGRKLDFLVQEMNREFNTIGSKSSDVALSEIVIAGKSEIEKIREQVQNIE